MIGDPSTLDSILVRRAALTVNVLLIITSLANLITYPVAFGSPLSGARLLQISWSGALLLVVLANRPPRRPRIDFAAYALAVLPHFMTLFFNAVTREEALAPFEPFLRQKVLVFVLAIASPGEVVVTGALIVASAVNACLESWLLAERFARASPRGEPWVTILLAAVAMWLLVWRAHTIARERDLQRRVRDAEQAARRAQMSLAARDLANTPIQSIELVAALLEEQPAGDARRFAEPLRRALARLRSLEGLLRDGPETTPS
jgi:hypothetical protein